MLDEHVHEVCVANSVHGWHNDRVELSVLWYGGHLLQHVCPWHPLAQALLDKLIVEHLSLLREGHREWLSWSLTLLKDVVKRPKQRT